ncbi:MAG: tripartite tricarboxylate transporter substrate-binding protein [Ideonella sp.]
MSDKLPLKDLKAFVAWARTQGDKLSYASVGAGSSSHLSWNGSSPRRI